MNIDYMEFANRINNCTNLYIYGAGIVGYGVYKAVFELYDKKARAFIVSDKNSNPNDYAGLKVIDVVEYSEKITDSDLVVVATPPEYHNDIGLILENYKSSNYVFLTSELEYALMSSYFKQSEGILCIDDLTYTNHTIPMDTKVYMAISHNDKNLNNIYSEEDYVCKIQVGKANTDVIHNDAVVFDDYNDNISSQNSLYGELTATYSIWKNYHHKITGLFHYRRILDVKPEQLRLISEDIIDVILPLPFVCYPNASGQYGRYLCSEDIEIMKAVIFESYPELKDRVIDELGSSVLYNYNMLIARKEVFNDYCEWIFPMLEEISARCESVKRERMSRYIGRIGEVLTSLYFTLNINKWKIAHAPKIWRI